MFSCLGTESWRKYKTYVNSLLEQSTMKVSNVRNLTAILKQDAGTLNFHTYLSTQIAFISSERFTDNEAESAATMERQASLCLRGHDRG